MQKSRRMSLLVLFLFFLTFVVCPISIAKNISDSQGGVQLTGTAGSIANDNKGKNNGDASNQQLLSISKKLDRIDTKISLVSQQIDAYFGTQSSDDSSVDSSTPDTGSTTDGDSQTTAPTPGQGSDTGESVDSTVSTPTTSSTTDGESQPSIPIPGQENISGGAIDSTVSTSAAITTTEGESQPTGITSDEGNVSGGAIDSTVSTSAAITTTEGESQPTGTTSNEGNVSGGAIDSAVSTSAAITTTEGESQPTGTTSDQENVSGGAIDTTGSTPEEGSSVDEEDSTSQTPEADEETSESSEDVVSEEDQQEENICGFSFIGKLNALNNNLESVSNRLDALANNSNVSDEEYTVLVQRVNELRARIVLELNKFETMNSPVLNKLNNQLEQQETFPVQQNVVGPDKVWEIKFNKKINDHTINGMNIFVVDAEENLVPTTVSVNTVNNSILISPDENYLPGTYTLFISKDIQSASKAGLKKAIKVEFTVAGS